MPREAIVVRVGHASHLTLRSWRRRYRGAGSVAGMAMQKKRGRIARVLSSRGVTSGARTLHIGGVESATKTL